MAAPVTKSDALLARNAATPDMSCGTPHHPARVRFSTQACSSHTCSRARCDNSVSIHPGNTAFTSMMSLFGAPYATPYASSKGGIVQMSRALATAWAKDNIQVNAVLPGWIDTELTQRAREQVSELHASVEKRTPAGRWGVPHDMSGVAAFLASKASGFVTGAAIPVDGGFSITT